MVVNDLGIELRDLGQHRALILQQLNLKSQQDRDAGDDDDGPTQTRPPAPLANISTARIGCVGHWQLADGPSRVNAWQLRVTRVFRFLPSYFLSCVVIGNASVRNGEAGRFSRFHRFTTG